jgi:hypothetical protein
MRRVRRLTLTAALAGLLLGGAGTTTAFAADSPVPGTPPGVSAGTQPASASIGSSAQPNSSASLGSGRTSSAADGQSASHSTCGAGVGAAGNSFGAQPTQVGTSGTSAPSGCGSGGAAGNSGQGAPNSGVAPNRVAGANTGSTSTTAGDAAGLASRGSASPSGGWLLAAFKLAWVLLAMLVAFLFFLLGAALARRRRQPESA